MKQTVSIGDTFGKLTVVDIITNFMTKNGFSKNELCVCSCECGSIVTVKIKDLLSHKVHSCECDNQSSVRIRRIWSGMLQRCSNKNLRAYKYYGGRGIVVCEEWKEFNNFYEWAIGAGYTDQLTIERVDVNGNYSPDNCIWVYPKEQNINKRNSVRLKSGTPLVLLLSYLNIGSNERERYITEYKKSGKIQIDISELGIKLS